MISLRNFLIEMQHLLKTKESSFYQQACFFRIFFKSKWKIGRSISLPMFLLRRKRQWWEVLDDNFWKHSVF